MVRSINRKVIVAVWVIALIGGCHRPTPEQEAAIRASFLTFKAALTGGDGDTALTVLDRNTIEHYRRMLDLALRGDERTVRALPLSDKVVVLSLRHRVPRDMILAATPEAVIKHAVENHWATGGSVANLHLGPIHVRGGTATGSIMLGMSDTDRKFTFHQEAGAWKVDLATVQRQAAGTGEALIGRMEGSGDENLVYLIESDSGEKVSDRIWEPLLPTAAD